LEQGLTLERGLVQASGLRATYDLKRPRGGRLVEVTIGDAPLDDARVYRVATNSFLAQGGDLYQTFLKTKTVDDGKVLLSDVVMEHLRAKRTVSAPETGRLAPVGRPR
jgi:5'-nucleotidase